MILQYNLNNRMLIILLFILFFSCKESPLSTVECADYGLYEDDCGECVQCNENCDCDLAVCDYNNEKDSCNVCFGDNSSCTGCTNSIASNYDDGATIECLDCCIYADIFIVFSDEDGFNSSLHQSSTNIPIYWLNNSDHSITIETNLSPQPYCTRDLESEYINLNCATYENDNECTTESQGCLWEIPASHNAMWDNFSIVVPAGTSTNSQIQYYFSGFSEPAGYGYYYRYGEGNDEIYYGYINIE